MNTTTEPPYHHLQTDNSVLSNLTQKSILTLLSTKRNISFKNLKQTHALVLKTGYLQDHYIAGHLMKCYANPHFNSLNSSITVLGQVPNPNVFVWNCVIKGCLDNNEPVEAMHFYHMMVVEDSRPNSFTYPLLFKACGIEQAVAEGLQIHAHVVKRGFFTDGHVISSGIQMYSSFGMVKEARNMLDVKGDDADIVCYNAMIDGYMKSGDVGAAKMLFDLMNEKSICSWNTMIKGFSENGLVNEAEKCFRVMPGKDDVSWSVMIDCYNKGGYFKVALDVFDEMQGKGILLSKHVLSGALTACANIAALDQGKWIHAYIRRNSIPLDGVLGTSLIDMYAKCGHVDLSREVFVRMKQKEEVFTWNAMIGGLAINGKAEEAMELFLDMGRRKVKPNGITFVALLNACAHAGLVDKGLNYFYTMKESYGVEAKIEHYGCIVDLLGRAGLLSEAERVISSMPMRPNAAIWGAFLGACRVYNNIELAERIAKNLLELEPDNSGRYVLLSNIYAKARRWDDLAHLRKLMKDRGIKTVPGTSVLYVNGIVHEFKVGEHTHPRIKDIHLMLEKIMEKVHAEGHIPNTSEVLFDLSSEEDKETALKYHSEKLAIAFGILNTEPGSTIRIVKNLRVCKDCHSVTKLISKVYKCDIIVRDRTRFHHFKDGECSCKDFW